MQKKCILMYLVELFLQSCIVPKVFKHLIEAFYPSKYQVDVGWHIFGIGLQKLNHGSHSSSEYAVRKYSLKRKNIQSHWTQMWVSVKHFSKYHLLEMQLWRRTLNEIREGSSQFLTVLDQAWEDKHSKHVLTSRKTTGGSSRLAFLKVSLW